jgi:outer membrane lipoprotein-sorting protein
MKRSVIYLWFTALVFLSVLVSCKEKDNSTNAFADSNYLSNIPVTSSVANSFSFVVNARSYNYSQIQAIQFNADTLSIAITIANFISGSGKIIIEDGNGNSIYEKDLNGAMVSASVLQVSAIPKTVNLNLTNFTGEVTIGLSGK